MLGAGGFTLAPETFNRYPPVDIDPQIREIAETRSQGADPRDFVVDDARRYVKSTERRFDGGGGGCVQQPHVDPGHLVTQEFWHDACRCWRRACCSPT